MLRTISLIAFLVCVVGHASAQTSDTLFINAAYLKLERARDYTLEIARLMPAANYAYKPSSDQMTFGQQLLHLSRNLGWLASDYLMNKDANPVASDDMKLSRKDSIISVVERAYRYALHAVKAFPPDQLGDSVRFFAGPMRKIQIINLLHDHQAHHRGQLVVYLRMSGLKPPPYRGW